MPVRKQVGGAQKARKRKAKALMQDARQCKKINNMFTAAAQRQEEVEEKTYSNGQAVYLVSVHSVMVQTTMQLFQCSNVCMAK